MRERNKKYNTGFTLIELLVVIAIIALLSSIALIALTSAREKSRDTNRVANMEEMNNALELFFTSNKGYPSGTVGIPQGMKPGYVSSLPVSPTPADGVCDGAVHNPNPALDSCTQADPSCASMPVNNYYYVASGTPYSNNGLTVYPDYSYYFCIGDTTSSLAPGIHVITPRGVK